MRRAGFTLIELLIVVAILAILTAILLPALSVAKEKANRVACMNNQKQTAVAITIYASEQDGWMLDRYRGDPQLLAYNDGLGDVFLGALITAGIVSEPPDIFYCPSSRFAPGWETPYFNSSNTPAAVWATRTGGKSSYSTYQAICSWTNAGTDTYANVREKIHRFDPRQAIMADWLFDANASTNATCPGNHGIKYFNYIRVDGSAHGFSDLRFFAGGWSSSIAKFAWFEND